MKTKVVRVDDRVLRELRINAAYDFEAVEFFIPEMAGCLESTASFVHWSLREIAQGHGSPFDVHARVPEHFRMYGNHPLNPNWKTDLRNPANAHLRPPRKAREQVVLRIEYGKAENDG